jgi:hypothetical protein
MFFHLFSLLNPSFKYSHPNFDIAYFSVYRPEPSNDPGKKAYEQRGD